LLYVFSSSSDRDHICEVDEKKKKKETFLRSRGETLTWTLEQATKIGKTGEGDAPR
jgi:hypothetical protein